MPVIASHQMLSKSESHYHIDRIQFRDVKNFLPKIHYRMTTVELKQQFESVDDQRSGEIGFDQFYELIKKITWDEKVIVSAVFFYTYYYCLFVMLSLTKRDYHLRTAR